MDDSSSSDEEKIPPPTAPERFSVSLRGFADSNTAERFGRLIGGVVRSISCYIDVDRLEGITVAFDYDGALAELDRGDQESKPLTRTATDKLVGVAMTPTVLREGIVKSHMIFSASHVLALEEDGTEAFQLAFCLVAHECGHVEDLKYMDLAFPGSILRRQITDPEDILLEPISDVLWQEYAASRASAIFGKELTAIYEEALTLVLPSARERANEAIRAYRRHTDLHRVMREAGGPLCEPLRAAAYLIGTLDGRGADLGMVPRARDLLQASPYEGFVQRLASSLQELWARRGRWSTPAEFDVLKNIVRDMLADAGIILNRQSNGGLYIDIPFTRDTMPI
jgi:hypothetical protein